MNNTFDKIAIGGPFNGNHVPHWQGDLVEYPDNILYRRLPVRLGEAYGIVYVINSLTDEEALAQLQELYLGI
jgi:hypothetical protein